MTDLRTAAQQALDDLKDLHKNHNITCAGTITALESALAQQAEPVEPYCYVYEYDGVFGLHREFYPLPYNGMKPSRTVPVYTTPPQRKPLTEEEIERICMTYQSPRQAARAVERSHKIGDNT